MMETNAERKASWNYSVWNKELNLDGNCGESKYQGRGRGGEKESKLFNSSTRQELVVSVWN
jgi:hypothetical protein